ncbi:hypothetical protein AV540_00740 [Brevibacillus parabrevis]|uniref:hypothetical protein n=1 Tax=Brevibacillus parabrevis TaxID=54914 RepID=UPI0007AB9982|nr:hypothetical protein [Brevibacillus parabrevis]KZE48120.1 hypothetical protein AV540_00740 [Brevibacillus parabrevis]
MTTTIRSVIICENTTSAFEPINPATVFYPEINDCVQVLVSLNKITTNTAVTFHWFISSEPQLPLAVYEIPMEASNNPNRFAVGVLELKGLLKPLEFNIYQNWFVNVECEGVYIKKEFAIRKHSIYGVDSKRQYYNNSSISRVNWKG